MSRITDYVLEPNIVYTNGSFLIKVKVQDDYKYKKYLVSENIKYKTISGTTFTLTDVKQDQPGSILQLEGNTTQNGTPTPTSPIEINTVSKDNDILIRSKNLFNKDETPTKETYYIGNNGSFVYNTEFNVYKVYLKPNTKYTLTNSGASYAPGMCFYDSNDNFLSGFSYNSTKYITFTTPVNTSYTLMSAVVLPTSGRYDLETMQLEEGNQHTSYESYISNNYRVDLGVNNLINYPNMDYNNDGIWTTNNNGVFTFSGTLTQSYFALATTTNITLKPGTYTLSRESDNLNYRVTIRVYNSSNVRTDHYIEIGTTSKTFTLTEEIVKSYIFASRLTSGETISGTVKVQLEEGSVANSFTPTNISPIEVCKIGNYVDSIKKSTGKNIAEFDTTKDTSKYTYSSYIPSNITVNKTATGGSFYASFTLHIPSAGTYLINGKALSSQQLYIYTDSLWGTLKESFTVSAGDFSRGTIFNEAGDYVIGLYGSATGNYAVKNFMCISEASSTTYEPYGNNWYVEKNIGKVVLNGSETGWHINNTGAANWYYEINNSTLIPTAKVQNNQLSNRYSNGEIYNGNTNTGIMVLNSGHTIRIRYGTEDTITNYQNWLSSNNVNVYYILANTTYETITNENLIQQLNGIQNMQLIENLCYIDWVGVEYPTMLLQYGSTDILHANIITEDGKKIRTDWGI